MILGFFNRIVKTLISLILKEEKGNVANIKRFVDDFGGQTLFMPKTNPKPEDYMMTFNGNVEDNYKIGMAVTKKSIKVSSISISLSSTKLFFRS